MTEEQFDAIGEVANIFTGAAACCLGNILDADVDMSIPMIEQRSINDDSVIDTYENKNIVEFAVDYTSSNMGRCVFICDENAELFNRPEVKSFAELAELMVSDAVKPLISLLEQKIYVRESDQILFDNCLTIKFNLLIEDDCVINVLLQLRDNVAEDIANLFLNQGIAIMAV